MKIPISILPILFLKSIAANIPTQLIVTRVGPCLDQKSTELVKVSEMSLHKNGSSTSLSGPLEILKDIENGWSVKATMQKCHDIRNLDTCDFYKATAIIRDGCEDEDQTLFQDFAKYFTPRLSCPIARGKYSLRALPYDTGSILINAKSKISTSVFGYTYRLEGFNFEDNRIFCIESKLRMIYVRKHNWIGTQKLERDETSAEVTTKAIETENRDDIDSEKVKDNKSKENSNKNDRFDEEGGKTGETNNGDCKNSNEDDSEKETDNKLKDNYNINEQIDEEGVKTGDLDQTETEIAKGDSETEKGHSETQKNETGIEEGDRGNESETDIEKDEAAESEGKDTEIDITEAEKEGVESEMGGMRQKCE